MRKSATKYVSGKLTEFRNFIRVRKATSRGDFSNVIWLIGDGRSGTTWIANLLNADKSYREMFEPFHPKKVNGAKEFRENMFVDANSKEPALERFMASVFDGSLTNSWIDKELLSNSYEGLLVKDVFANLHAKWSVLQFPLVKPILLVRNPLSVAASKYVTKRWHWPSSPEAFLNDKALIATHLKGLEEVILKVAERNDYIEKQILNWCVIHKVISRQFTLDEIHVICYERVLENPQREISEALAFSGKKQNAELTPNKLRESSIVSFKGSSVIENKDPLTIWKENITQEQVELATNLLKDFELDGWYEDFHSPCMENILLSFKKSTIN